MGHDYFSHYMSVTTCSRIISQSQVVNCWTLYRQSCWYPIEPSGLFY